MKKKKVIVKSVCLNCSLVMEKKLNTPHDIILAGKEFECEWCEEPVLMYKRFAQFYKFKGEKN